MILLWSSLPTNLQIKSDPMANVNSIKSCEVCRSTDLDSILNLGLHPLCDDLVLLDEARQCIEYPIEILYCEGCATAHQRFQISKQDLFPRTYHYRPRFTADVLNGMSALVDACEGHFGSKLTDKLILDVGCNDGSLLDFFCKKGAKTVGIEPTGAYSDGLGKGHSLYNEYLSTNLAKEILAVHGTPDIITFTNVFAHIENLPEMVNSLKVLMSPTTMLVIENHYLGSVLERNQFDTFYHEHLRTYSLTSFQHIAKSLGVSLNAVEFPSRYGGNIRVFLGKPVVSTAENRKLFQSVLLAEAHFGKQLHKMQSQVESWKNLMGIRIRELVAKHGRLSGKAFPGRAAILIKLLDLDVDMIEAIYEKPGSMKIGHYLPGTHIPIRDETELFSSMHPPAVILNLAWHISDEIRQYCNEKGYKGEIVDILDSRELTP